MEDKSNKNTGYLEENEAYNRMLDIGCSVHKQTVFQRLIGKSSSILETLNGGERPKLLLEEVLL